MATLDFTPLFRSSIGFDQLPGLLSHALQREDGGYPPYNIEKLGEDQYRIVLAVAGCSNDDVEIVQEQNRLFVRGRIKEPGEKTYLHRGIAARPFEPQFDLADYGRCLPHSHCSSPFLMLLSRKSRPAAGSSMILEAS